MSDAHREEIKKLESLYAEHPEGRIFTHLAEAYRKAGELEQARAVLEDGIGKHPDYSSAHVVLGRVLMDQDRTAEAEAEFLRVIELDAHNMVALRALGDLARRDGRSEDALDYYHRLLEVEPADEDVRALVEQVIAGDVGAPEGAAPGTREAGEEPVEETWAPHGLVEGSPFEEAAWSLSDQDEPGYADEPEDADEPADADALPADDLATSDPYAPVDRAAAGDEATDQPADEPTDEPMDAPIGDPTDGDWVPFGSAAADASEGIDETDELDTDDADGDDDLPWLTGAEPSEMPEGGAFERPGEPGEDTDDGAVDAPWGQAPWEQAAIGEPGDSEDLEDEPPPPVRSPGVMTETIAQVYARQGLYDRAADVYRELVRERPHDDGLRERLAEMEELAAHVASTRGGTSLTGTETPESEAEDEAEDEVPQGLETFDAQGAAAEEAPVAGEERPVEGLEPADADLAAEPVPLEGLETQDVDPDTHLLEAGDGSGEGVEVPPELDVRDVPQPPEEEPWAERHADADPWAATPAEAGSGEVASDDVESDDVESDEGESQDAEAEPASEPTLDPEEGSVWTGAEWGEAEATTPYAWAESEPEPEPDDTAPVEQYFRGLLGWDGGRSASASPAEEAGGQTEASAQTGAEPGAGPDAGTAGGADTGAREAGSGDDDDLEMFRSWLESLKQ